MNSDERDPLLEKLRGLPVESLNASRSAETLHLAEMTMSRKVRPGMRWPQLAVSIALSTAGFVYTVGSVNKIERIYLSNHETTQNIER